MRRSLPASWHAPWRAIRLALGLLLAAAAVQAPPALALDVPPQGGQWVVDNARLLPAREKNALASRLRAYAAESGNQIVVLTLPSLEGEELSGYANRVAREWGVGQKDKNNGLLILVAKAEGKVRFEVGRGIEDRVPDILAKRIQQEITVPHFRARRFGPGLEATFEALRQALALPGEAGQTPAPQAPQAPGPGPAGGAPWLTIGLVVLAAFLSVAYFSRRSRSSSMSSGRFSDRFSGRSSGGDSSFFVGLLLGLLSSLFRGRGGGGPFDGGGGGGDGGFSGGGGDFGGGGSSSDFGDDR